MSSQGGMSSEAYKHVPYPPRVWTLGGAPEKHIDLPVQSVFLALFATGAAINMTIFQLNKRRGHKFLPNLFMFIFCMARVGTSVLRIASVSLPHDIPLAIAAQIFVAAGVLIIFIINLVFSQRVVRSIHPSVGWHPSFSLAFKILYVCIGLTLAIVITATVQTFYSLNTHTNHIDRSLQLYGSTFLAVIATLPIPIVVTALLIPHGKHDKFGTGRFRTKATVLLIGTSLLAFGAWYRCGTTWRHPVPRTQPLPKVLGKGPFYVANFTVEILTIYLYALVRVDRRWHIPNGAKGPGSYSQTQHPVDAENGHIKPSEEALAADANAEAEKRHESEY